MSRGNDSAFPCPVGHIDCAHPTGLTVREYFAASAMAVFANPTIYENVVSVADAKKALMAEMMARYCVEFADAMLKRLEKP